MDKDKLKEYIDLCAPSFLIKMKTKTDKSYFFKAHPSGTDKDPAYKEGIFRFTIADIDDVGDETTHHYREINLNNEFDDLESLKAVIIPEHKDMYKDIVTEEMKVDCDKDNCSGDALQTKSVVPAPPIKRRKPGAISPPKLSMGIGNTDRLVSGHQAQTAPPLPIGKSLANAGGGKKKKKRRKKSSRSKKRRNKRKNRTKKN